MSTEHTCPDCGETVEYLVDVGICQDCLHKRIDKEQAEDKGN